MKESCDAGPPGKMAVTERRLMSGCPRIVAFPLSNSAGRRRAAGEDADDVHDDAKAAGYNVVEPRCDDDLISWTESCDGCTGRSKVSPLDSAFTLLEEAFAEPPPLTPPFLLADATEYMELVALVLL